MYITYKKVLKELSWSFIKTMAIKLLTIFRFEEKYPNLMENILKNEVLLLLSPWVLYSYEQQTGIAEE